MTYIEQLEGLNKEFSEAGNTFLDLLGQSMINRGAYPTEQSLSLIKAEEDWELKRKKLNEYIQFCKNQLAAS